MRLDCLVLILIEINFENISISLDKYRLNVENTYLPQAHEIYLLKRKVKKKLRVRLTMRNNSV